MTAVSCGRVCIVWFWWLLSYIYICLYIVLFFVSWNVCCLLLYSSVWFFMISTLDDLMISDLSKSLYRWWHNHLTCLQHFANIFEKSRFKKRISYTPCPNMYISTGPRNRFLSPATNPLPQRSGSLRPRIPEAARRLKAAT